MAAATVGRTARLMLTRTDAFDEADSLVRAQLNAIELACGPELRACTGGTTTVSPLLGDLVRTALRMARDTNGDVDPTVTEAPLDLARSAWPQVGHRVPGWQRIRLDGRQLTVPKGVLLDLGAIARAFAVDRCAEVVNTYLRVGVLVRLGGNVATAGPAPRGGWRVQAADEALLLAPGTAAATTSTWRRDGRWRTVTVMAPTCVAAGMASSAALVRDWAAVPWLRSLGLAARLVDAAGEVLTLGGWPA